MGGELVRLAGGRRRAVNAIPLRHRALETLRAMVGDDCELVDVRDADGTEALVIVPAVSRQLLGRMRQAFPEARIVVVELRDLAHGVDLGGPVTRSLDWGADGYVVASSLLQLADALRTPPVEAEPAAVPALTQGEEHDLAVIVDALVQRRATTPIER